MTGSFSIEYNIIRELHSDSRKLLSAQRAAVEREGSASLAATRRSVFLTHTLSREGEHTCVRLDPYDIARSRYSRALTRTIYRSHVQYRCILFQILRIISTTNFTLLTASDKATYSTYMEAFVTVL